MNQHNLGILNPGILKIPKRKLNPGHQRIKTPPHEIKRIT